ncbi:hypothetical protein [Vibrio sp. Isolate30]|uniref:hypothetical protein n=1 Tax=Vibrio sp. Isolate30 TaxID=2908536 RepID=UPI001EFCAE1D|nr:hypothetical protein [Vibrio sp. Isolate30]MCG9632751.1 hypothetical protein [Vibrio sp. Isolate30]
MEEGKTVNEKASILFESLRRTDSYIVAADQKASITLAAGVTFLGIYTSIFYGLISGDDVVVPTTLIVSVVGIVIISWVYWFNKLKDVFVPRVTPSKGKSIVSFASMVETHDSLDNFIHYYSTLNSMSQSSTLTDLERDLLENHWICAEICSKKMGAFKKSLSALLLSLSVSLLGLAFVTFYADIIT